MADMKDSAPRPRAKATIEFADQAPGANPIPLYARVIKAAVLGA